MGSSHRHEQQPPQCLPALLLDNRRQPVGKGAPWAVAIHVQIGRMFQVFSPEQERLVRDVLGNLAACVRPPHKALGRAVQFGLMLRMLDKQPPV
jgi:hypothetical protein